MTQNYSKTKFACFVGYIVQAIVNNFAPLLFVTFQNEYGISLEKITLLITVNFAVQLCIDLLSSVLIDRIGYRKSVMIAHAFATVGMLMLPILPELLPDAFVGILVSVVIYAVGGGMLEVIISPMIEACPSDNKSRTMSLLHSFYCWGHVGVVLISTAFFALFGISNWRILAFVWAAVPAVNMILFARAPICTLEEDGNKGHGIRKLLSNGLFWVFFLMMICSGAAELSVSQWASSLAERGLGVSKAVGDLAGTMAFALLMGIARIVGGRLSSRFDMRKLMMLSSLLCIASYLCIILSENPLIALVGCAMSGFAVGILWPGTYSMAAESLRGGGTAMFALLALGGDIGCTGGPTLTGLVSGAYGDDLRVGLTAAIVFPILMIVGLILIKLVGSKKENKD